MRKNLIYGEHINPEERIILHTSIIRKKNGEVAVRKNYKYEKSLLAANFSFRRVESTKD